MGNKNFIMLWGNVSFSVLICNWRDSSNTVSKWCGWIEKDVQVYNTALTEHVPQYFS